MVSISTPAAAQQPAKGVIRLVAFGDSLMAGYGIDLAQAFPARLQRALVAQGHAVEVANAGVSGDTTADGLARLDWAVPDKTDGVILEFGANDMLRGIDPAVAQRNLAGMIERLQAKHVTVLLAGMISVRNWGEDYAHQFNAMYGQLAKIYGLELYPFFLDGVVEHPELKLADGLHPNPAGVDRIVAGILPFAERLVVKLEDARGVGGAATRKENDVRRGG